MINRYFSLLGLSLGFVLIMHSCVRDSSSRHQKIQEVLQAFFESLGDSYLLIDSLFYLDNEEGYRNEVTQNPLLTLLRSDLDIRMEYDSTFVSNKKSKLWSTYIESDKIVSEGLMEREFESKCQKLKREGLSFACDQAVVYSIPYTKSSMPYFTTENIRAYVIVHKIFSRLTASHQIYQFIKNPGGKWIISEIRNF